MINLHMTNNYYRNRLVDTIHAYADALVDRVGCKIDNRSELDNVISKHVRELNNLINYIFDDRNGIHKTKFIPKLINLPQKKEKRNE